jgi:hypothetical protein
MQILTNGNSFLSYVDFSFPVPEKLLLDLSYPMPFTSVSTFQFSSSSSSSSSSSDSSASFSSPYSLFMQILSSLSYRFTHGVVTVMETTVGETLNTPQQNNPFVGYIDRYHVSLTEILLILCDVWRDMETRENQKKKQEKTGDNKKDIINEGEQLNKSSSFIPISSDITPKLLLLRTLTFLRTLFNVIVIYLSKQYPILLQPNPELVEHVSIMNEDEEKETYSAIGVNSSTNQTSSFSSSSVYPPLPISFIFLYLFYIALLAHFNKYNEILFSLRTNIIPPHPEILHQLLFLCTRRLPLQYNITNLSSISVPIPVLPPYCYHLLPFTQRMADTLVNFYSPVLINGNKLGTPFSPTSVVGCALVAYLLSGLFSFHLLFF